MWPTDADALIARQRWLAELTPDPWSPPDDLCLGGAWVCFPRGYAGPGRAGDPAYAAAVAIRGGACVDQAVGTGVAGAPYVPGLLALRIGALVGCVTRELTRELDVLLVDATGRDHPRRAGLAVHLGAELDLPTVGVTHRPLLAEGAWPGDVGGDTSPLRIGDEQVGAWVRTRPGTRPLAVHPGWKVDLDTAVEVVLRSSPRHRTPEPLRLARHAARELRIRSGQPVDPA